MTWVTKKRYLILSAKENEVFTQLQQKQACFPPIPCLYTQKTRTISEESHPQWNIDTLDFWCVWQEGTFKSTNTCILVWKSGNDFIVKCTISVLSKRPGIITKNSQFPSECSKNRVPRRGRIYLCPSFFNKTTFLFYTTIPASPPSSPPAPPPSLHLKPHLLLREGEASLKQ